MSDFTIAALMPMQHGWEDKRIVIALPDAREILEQLQLWTDMVREFSEDTPEFRGGTFRSYSIWPEVVEVPSGAPGWPNDSNWGKIDSALVGRRGHPPTRNQIPVSAFHWIITPYTSTLVFEMPGKPNLRAPVITTSMIMELTSNPLEILAEVGISGKIKGFPKMPGRYRVKANVNGVEYEKSVDVVPSETLAGNLEVKFADGTRIDLGRMVPNSEWHAL
jgi:hypothetical protein